MAVSAAEATPAATRKPFYSHLYVQVLAAILIGGLLGHFFRGEPWIEAYLKPLGDAFIKLVKMIIAPVIFLTIALGVAGMRDMSRLGRVAWKAFTYFLIFSTLALIVGLLVGNLVQPGAGMNADLGALDPEAAKRVQGYQEKSDDLTIVGFLMDIIPATFVGAFTSGIILQVLFLAILFGISLAAVGEAAAPVVAVMESAASVVFRMVGILMKAAPIGALGAFAFVISDQGLGALQQLGLLIGAVYATSAIFILVILGAVAALHGFSIFRLIGYLRDELLLVFGTSSSESALPGLMDKLERAGCARPVVGLVVPTGYSFNLDGTNIYMTLAALFIAQATNTPLTLGDQVALLLVAMVSSKGAAGVTGAGFITLAATLQAVDTIPAAGMTLILAIDRFLSECRAITNFIGNAVATLVVSRWEGALDRDRLKEALSGPPSKPAPAYREADPD